jgi:hypothetical protein
MTVGRSLHIGLNELDPQHYAGWDGALNACEFDANDMEEIAESRGFETSKLLTREAKCDAVLSAIERAAAQLESGDIYFVTYAGYGGQVPDRNEAEEPDRTDGTWLLYDRQLIDDELYALWAKFRPGVRILVLSDTCHSGSVTKRIEDEDVPDVVATAAEAARLAPRYRAMPRDTMISTYRQNAELYDDIQKSVPGSTESAWEFGATVLMISGCQDHQLSLDGFGNGRFTEELKKVWADGAWQGGYPAFHHAIVEGMPEDQTPNYNLVGASSPDFEQQKPFTVH